MKKKILLLATLLILAVGGIIYGFTYAHSNRNQCANKAATECSGYQHCPKKGQADCPYMHNCPQNAKGECPYMHDAEGKARAKCSEENKSVEL